MNSFLNQNKPIINALNGETYTLIPLYAVEPSAHHFEQVTAICNERLVYHWCFRVLCMAEAYPVSLASEWFTWAKEGWESGSHYVYALMSATGEIVGSCDIKSGDCERAEIGYWCSKKHRGVMTNAVRALLELASQAGYQCLSAAISTGNTRSISLIRRCGFDRALNGQEVDGNLEFEVRLVDALGVKAVG